MNGKIGLIALCAIVLAGLIFSQQGTSLKSSTMSFETETPDLVVVPAGESYPITVKVAQDGEPVIDEPFKIRVEGPGFVQKTEDRMSIGAAKQESEKIVKYAIDNGVLTFYFFTKGDEEGSGQITVTNNGQAKVFKTLVVKKVTAEWKTGPSDLGKMIYVQFHASDGTILTSDQNFRVNWDGEGFAGNTTLSYEEWFPVQTSAKGGFVRANLVWNNKVVGSSNYSY